MAIAEGSAMASFTASCGSSGPPDGVPGGMICRGDQCSLCLTFSPPMSVLSLDPMFNVSHIGSGVCNVLHFFYLMSHRQTALQLGGDSQNKANINFASILLLSCYLHSFSFEEN